MSVWLPLSVAIIAPFQKVMHVGLSDENYVDKEPAETINQNIYKS